MKQTPQRMLAERVHEGGFQCVHVFDAVPPFTYTVGLYAELGYELLVFALQPETAQGMLNTIAEKARKLSDFAFGESELLFGAEYYPVQYQRCNATAPRPYVVQADEYAGLEVPVVQIVLPDEHKRFPEQATYDRAHMGKYQPLCYDSKPNLH
jgi:hypothetical protein